MDVNKDLISTKVLWEIKNLYFKIQNDLYRLYYK
jgi:hypothetical protein